MRLVHFRDPSAGARIGRLDDDDTVVDLGPAEPGGALATLLKGASGGVSEGRSYSYAALDRDASSDEAHLLAPVVPPEVWGCGVTYKRSAEFRDSETGVEEGIYDKVYRAERPELLRAWLCTASAPTPRSASAATRRSLRLNLNWRSFLTARARFWATRWRTT